MIDPSVYKIYVPSGNESYRSFIEIDGVENLNIEHPINLNNPYILGGEYSSYLINSPNEVSVSFERSYVEKDPLILYTGNLSIDRLFICNGNQFLKINCLYMQQYTIAFSVGSLPKISNKFISYGNSPEFSNFLSLNDNSYVSAPIKNSEIMIPKLNSIFTDGDFYSNIFLKQNYKGEIIHNIYGFQYSVSIQRIPYYSVGSLQPKNIETITPYQINLTINSKASSKYKNDCLIKIKNDCFLNFCIGVSGDGVGNICYYCIQNAIMTNFSSQITSQNTLEITRNFIGNYGI